MAKLYIVGTPIGNLKDITLRALEVLREADFIACEDTRHSLKLLNSYDIKKPLFACHKHNENEAAEKICGLLRDGKNVALITDAGMPCVSDPGAVAVKKCREEGFEVESVPGPSAVTTAVSVSGIIAEGFAFLGFLPAKLGEKTEFLKRFQKLTVPMVFYSAPHDIESDAAVMLSVFGNRKVRVVKELTKIHENVTECTLENFDISEPKGEYVLIVDGAAESKEFLALSVEEHLKLRLAEGLDEKTAVKQVASERGLGKNEVYQIAVSLKKGTAE